MVCFGQLVIGPPGAGKTTYCQGMEMFCQQIGRPVAIVNLDFANDRLYYPCAIDVRDLITLENAMSSQKLGPNGGLVYCMEYLLTHLDWLLALLRSHNNSQASSLPYFIFDCPGQVELYSHQEVVQKVVQRMERELDMRLCAVQCVDTYYCCQPSTFISAVLLSTSTMLRLSLPSVNVLTKVDLLARYAPLPLPLSFFTDPSSLLPLTRYIGGRVKSHEEIEREEKEEREREERGEQRRKEREEGKRRREGEVGERQGGDSEKVEREEEEEEEEEEREGVSPSLSPFQLKFRKLSEALCEVLGDYNLVSFLPCHIEDAATVARVLANVDKANGYYSAHFHHQQLSLSSSPSPRTSNNNNNNENNKSTAAAQALFQHISDHLYVESNAMISMDIQEKYCS